MTAVKRCECDNCRAARDKCFVRVSTVRLRPNHTRSVAALEAQAQVTTGAEHERTIYLLEVLDLVEALAKGGDPVQLAKDALALVESTGCTSICECESPEEHDAAVEESRQAYLRNPGGPTPRPESHWIGEDDAADADATPDDDHDAAYDAHRDERVRS